MFSEEAINTQIQPQTHTLVFRKDRYGIRLYFFRFNSCKAEQYATSQHCFIDSGTRNSLRLLCDWIITTC
jgi:hypothetical protein